MVREIFTYLPRIVANSFSNTLPLDALTTKRNLSSLLFVVFVLHLIGVRKTMALLVFLQTLFSSRYFRVCCGTAYILLAFVVTFFLTLQSPQQRHSLLFDGNFQPQTPEQSEGRLQIHTEVPEERNETNFLEPSLNDWDHHYGLASSECDASFPKLFKEIDRAVALRKERANITRMDIDIS